ncbi:MAG: hypothetical protein ACXADX_03320 [Candidatus Hodarchaeales archaeon]|jgi:hypothetical protein
MHKRQILILTVLLYSTLLGSLYLQLGVSEDAWETTGNRYTLNSPNDIDQSESAISSLLSTKGAIPDLNSWEESENNSMTFNRTLDLTISQSMDENFPLDSLPDLTSSDAAQNALQADVGNLSITLLDGAEDTPYSDFEEIYSYDTFERTAQSPKDGTFSYNFSSSTGPGNFESKFKSYTSLHDMDNVTFLMNLWNSSETAFPINPYSTPMNLSFDYNLLEDENFRSAPYHRLEVKFYFREPDRPGGKSGSISIALLKHVLTPPAYDDADLRVETYSGIDAYGYSYSEINFNRSEVAAGSGWHHFEANITDILHRFLNTTVNITSHYSVLDFIEVWAVSSVGDFNYTLLIDNLQFIYWPPPAAVPLDLYWNGSATSLNDGVASLDNWGEISGVSLNSSLAELNPRLTGDVNLNLTRAWNETISTVITFENNSAGYFEANLSFPALITANELYSVSGVLPTSWSNLTVSMDGLNFPATITGLIPSSDVNYPLGELLWTPIGRTGILNGTIPNYLSQVSLPTAIQAGDWFIINGTLLAPSDTEVKANITFGATCLTFQTLAAIDGSFSLVIPSIDFGTHTMFELDVYWADEFQAGFWEGLVVVNSAGNPPPEIPEGELANLTPMGSGPVYTNATVDHFYRVDYPQNGSQWFANLPYDLVYANISDVELWRDNELIKTAFANQTFQWAIESTNNDEDLLVVKVEGPTLDIQGEQAGEQITLECRVHSPLAYDNVTLVVPLSSLEQTVENWTVLDYLDRDITSQVSMDSTNSSLFVYSLSISANSIFMLQFSGKIKPMSILALDVPTEVECDSLVQITGSFVSFYPLEGAIIYQVDNSSISVAIQTIHLGDNVYEFSANFSSPPWNVTYYSATLVLEDTYGNILESESFAIRSIDNDAPSVVWEYSVTSNGVNLSILALDGASESGIANVSVVATHDEINWTIPVIPGKKLGWYSALISDLSFEEIRITISAKDWAGNLAVVEDSISLLSTESHGDKGFGIDLSPALIGSAFLVTVLSGNQMVRLVKGRKVEL